MAERTEGLRTGTRDRGDPRPGVADQIEAVSERTHRRPSIQLDKRDGVNKAVHFEKVGDIGMFRGLTGFLADAATDTVYLTSNGEAHGESLFALPPIEVQVCADTPASAGGLFRADGPRDPTVGWKVSSSGTQVIDWQIEWLPLYACYAVHVTNGTGTDRDFLVTAWGP